MKILLVEITLLVEIVILLVEIVILLVEIVILLVEITFRRRARTTKGTRCPARESSLLTTYWSESALSS